MTEPPSRTTGKRLHFSFSPLKIALVLALLAGLLFLVSTFVFYVQYYVGHGWTFGYIGKKFDLLREANIPTWYSSFVIALAALLAMVIVAIEATLQERKAWPWLGISLVLLFLSADETAMIHEMTNDIIPASAPDAGGFLRHRWLYVYGALAVIVIAFFFPFFLKLSTRYKILFAVAAALYLGGALGGESITGHLIDKWGRDNFPYKLAASVEELLEMLGMIVFVYTLLDYAKGRLRGIEVSFGA